MEMFYSAPFAHCRNRCMCLIFNPMGICVGMIDMHQILTMEIWMVCARNLLYIYFFRVALTSGFVQSNCPQRNSGIAAVPNSNYAVILKHVSDSPFVSAWINSPNRACVKLYLLSFKFNTMYHWSAVLLYEHWCDIVTYIKWYMKASVAVQLTSMSQIQLPHFN